MKHIRVVPILLAAAFVAPTASAQLVGGAVNAGTQVGAGVQAGPVNAGANVGLRADSNVRTDVVDRSARRVRDTAGTAATQAHGAVDSTLDRTGSQAAVHGGLQAQGLAHASDQAGAAISGNAAAEANSAITRPQESQARQADGKPERPDRRER